MSGKYTVPSFIIVFITIIFTASVSAINESLVDYKLTSFNPGHYIGIFSLGDTLKDLKQKLGVNYGTSDLQKDGDKTIINYSFDNITLSYALFKGKVVDISLYWPPENLQYGDSFIIPRYTTISDVSKLFPLGRIRGIDPDTPCMYFDDVKSGITFMAEPITFFAEPYKQRFKNKKCLTKPGRKPECFVVNYIDIYPGY